MEELHILLTLNKENRIVFPDVLVVAFRNAKSIKDYLVGAKLSKLEESGEMWTMWEKNLLGIWFYKYYHNVHYRISYVGKAKIKFHYRFNNYKKKHRALKKSNQKVPQKRFHGHYCLHGHSQISNWNLCFLNNMKHMGSWKEQKTIGNTDLKPFTN